MGFLRYSHQSWVFFLLHIFPFQVCQLLHDPEKRIHEIEINLFTPFRPMLAENVPISEIEGRMGHKPFYIEVRQFSDKDNYEAINIMVANGLNKKIG